MRDLFSLPTVKSREVVPATQRTLGILHIPNLRVTRLAANAADGKDAIHIVMMKAIIEEEEEEEEGDSKTPAPAHSL